MANGETTIKKIKAATQAIWMQKPKDVVRVRQRLGARNQNFTIISYAESDTRQIMDFFYSVRTAAKHDRTDVATLIVVTVHMLALLGSRYVRYYDFVEAPRLMDETCTALKEMKTVDEFLEIVEALDTYLGKLNYFLDLEIPWDELSKEYKRVKGDV